MPTPHIAAEPGEFADICLLPGDPRRARHVAERHLEESRRVTAVRGMEGFTGTFRRRRVSVMGTGMGIPSASIYVTELVRHYGVTTLIRIGSCGAIRPELRLRDLIVVTGASTDSNANRLRFGGFDFAAVPDFDLTRALMDAAAERAAPVHAGPVVSCDAFYHPRPEIFELGAGMGILAAEMEAAGLFGVAAQERVRAAAILTVSDLLPDGGHMSPAERESSLDEMIAVALEAALRASDEPGA